MADATVIFDVDGVLLHLTPEEEDAFFWPFEQLHGLTGLSRDWDSYRIRNDENIIAEILENHLRRKPSEAEHKAIVETYIARWKEQLAAARLAPVAIPGARRLLADLASASAMIGIATANLREAARLRLDQAGLWTYVDRLAHGADGGGTKADILGRAIAAAGTPKHRIVYLGDNLTDVDAGLANGVHFIGFATDPRRRERLLSAGAPHVAGDHRQTLQYIRNHLGL